MHVIDKSKRLEPTQRFELTHRIESVMEAAMVLFIGWLQILGLHRKAEQNSRRTRWALCPATGGSRGDVPGWVLITLMSAILVAGLLAIAGPALEGLFNQAMEQVVP